MFQSGLRIQTKSHTIRFPEDVYIKLQLISKQTLYNFNATVIRILENGLAVESKLEEMRLSATEQVIEENTQGEDHGQA